MSAKTDPNSKTDNLANEDCRPVPCSTVPLRARLQDDLDWKVFAKEFESRNGFAPHRRDGQHKEYFHWFTFGAHSEFMGRLKVQANTYSRNT